MFQVDATSIKNGFFICCLLFMSVLFGQQTTPNIVLVLADDLGYGDLGCYGQTHFATPHIDALAKRGVRFTQHYAGSPVCAPSRAVLMTGKHTGHVSIRGNKQNPSGGQLPLVASEITFVNELQKAGYRTGGFGKWGLGNPDTSGSPLEKGFDTFFGYYDQILAHNSYPEYLYDNLEKIQLPNTVQYLPDTLWHKGLGSYSTVKRVYSQALIFEKALQFVDQSADAPFFLYYATTIPHDNGEAPEGRRIEIPDASKFENRPWTEEEKCYAAAIEYLDGQIGKLVAHLERKGLLNNTIFVFTSDHGAISYPNLNNNGGLRGFKRDVYEGGLRVPFIVSWPDKVETGTVSDHLSAFWDVGITLLEMVDITKLPNSDGISFYPELKGAPQTKHPYLYWEFHFWEPSRYAVRFGEWKALKNRPNAPLELYNIRADPSEQNNLADRYPNLIDQAYSYLKEAHIPSEEFPENPQGF